MARCRSASIDSRRSAPDCAATRPMVRIARPCTLAGLADVGQRRIAFTEDLQILVIAAADVADDVREQIAVGVAAGQVGLQLDAGEAPAVDGEARHLLVAHAQLQRDRQELAARLARLVERFQFFRADADDLRQPFEGGVHVLDLVRGHVQAEGRYVLGQQAAVAVVDHAAPGHHRPRLDAVGLRARGVDVVVQHLQLEVPAAQAQQADQHAQETQRRATAELFGFGVRVLDLAARNHGSAPALAEAHRVQQHEHQRPQAHAQQRRPPVRPRQGRLTHQDVDQRADDAVVEQQAADGQHLLRHREEADAGTEALQDEGQHHQPQRLFTEHAAV
ncbi:hypothetical protein G6F31_014073 [Rhizopus arrhizus]|nr:hypothetical protein G6F31_014073 [Rhizopus arrhizus]